MFLWQSYRVCLGFHSISLSFEVELPCKAYSFRGAVPSIAWWIPVLPAGSVPNSRTRERRSTVPAGSRSGLRSGSDEVLRLVLGRRRENEPGLRGEVRQWQQKSGSGRTGGGPNMVTSWYHRRVVPDGTNHAHKYNTPFVSMLHPWWMDWI